MQDYVPYKNVEAVVPGATDVAVIPNKMNPSDYGRQIAQMKDMQGEERPFFVMNCGVLIDQYERWCIALPRVKPYYAVKCNNDVALLRVLAELGCNFDCTSKMEMQLLINHLGISSTKILYAHPTKKRSHLKYAAEKNVNLMTFDNANELVTIKELHPNARLILRIAVSDNTAQAPLDVKFGCPPDHNSDALLQQAKELELNVVGVSFHIGSGAHDASAWVRGIEHARRLFDVGHKLGYNMNILDIGGGFVGVHNPEELLFEDAAKIINQALNVHFPEGCGTNIIAEPGRYFAALPFTLCTRVYAKAAVTADAITKKEAVEMEDLSVPFTEADSGALGYMYYIDDGAYCSFNCCFYDHQKVTPHILFEEGKSTDLYWTTIWGPTCDSLDCVVPKIRFPVLTEGTWLRFNNLGAYSIVSSTDFNGFEKPTMHKYISKSDLARICGVSEALITDKQLNKLNCPFELGSVIAHRA